jgi:hypothetical protein
MAANFLQKQRGQKQRGQKQPGRGPGRPFQKGYSGNPAGRPVGARNRVTEMAEALLDGQAGALVDKCVELALEGNPAAIKLCLERIVPRVGRSVKFDLPPITGPGDLGPAMDAIARAAAAGALTASDAAEFSRMIETYGRAMATSDLDRRLRELEEIVAAPGLNAGSAAWRRWSSAGHRTPRTNATGQTRAPSSSG